MLRGNKVYAVCINSGSLPRFKKVCSRVREIYESAISHYADRYGGWLGLYKLYKTVPDYDRIKDDGQCNWQLSE